MENQKPVKIYTKDYCPYCIHAKNFFKENGIEYTEVKLSDSADEIKTIQSELGWRTLPMIMIAGDMIGGYSDMKALADAGN